MMQSIDAMEAAAMHETAAAAAPAAPAEFTLTFGGAISARTEGSSEPCPVCTLPYQHSRALPCAKPGCCAP